MNCIVVPVYKEFSQLTIAEVKSFEQLLMVLGRHDIVLITFEGIGYNKYLEFAIRKTGKKLLVKLYDSEYFENLTGYNKLLTSKKFYLSFKEYKYMLIYQLDAWVFRDELEQWCKKGYDYVGAPWFEGYHKPESEKIIGVGNGGFSLRKIKSFLKVLNRLDNLPVYRNFWYKSRLQSIIRFEPLISRLYHLTDFSRAYELSRSGYQGIEDIYWSKVIPAIFNDFKVAEVRDAIKFSFECKPSYLFAKNDGKLPFGCHAWEKYEPEFWKDHINI